MSAAQIVALYSPDGLLGAKFRRVLGDRYRAVCVTNHRELYRSMDRVRCVVVIEATSAPAPDEIDLRALLVAWPLKRWVLVADPDSTAIDIADPIIDEIVFSGSVEAEVISIVERLMRRTAIDHLSARVGRIAMDEIVKKMILTACSAEPPIVTVQRLASRIRLATSTLYRRWQRSFGPAFTLRDFLRWVLLVRFAHRAGSGGIVNGLRSVRVDRRTLVVAARDLAGAAISDLRDAGPADIEMQFEHALGHALSLTIHGLHLS